MSDTPVFEQLSSNMRTIQDLAKKQGSRERAAADLELLRTIKRPSQELQAIIKQIEEQANG